jgi:toxin ParE1/3/4
MSDSTSAKKATLELVERMDEDVTFEDNTDPGRDP